MKKKIALFLMIAVSLFSLTGCDSDDDADTAYFFEGYWEGRMGSYFYDELGYGADYYYSQLDIVRTNSYGGYGTERDYNGNYSYNVISFNWTVQDGLIYFRYSNGAEVVLDFSLVGDGYGNDRMNARVYDTATGDAIGTAELYRLNSWYNDWYDDPYWAKPNAIPDDKNE